MERRERKERGEEMRGRERKEIGEGRRERKGREKETRGEKRGVGKRDEGRV